MKKSLVIAGSGIKFISHLTHETKIYIEQSNKVLYLVNEPAMKEWIQQINSNAESLDDLYFKYPLRAQSYKAITDYILKVLVENDTVCVIFYGHPLIFTQPALNSAMRAKNDGFDVKILPGISAEDCLFADLVIDPGSCGCLSFDATDFLVSKRLIDPRSHLLLWQIGRLGVIDHSEMVVDSIGLTLLVEYLKPHYDLNHEIILYEAALYPHIEPKIIKLSLGNLSSNKCSRLSTLYVPPFQKTVFDEETLALLGLEYSDSSKEN